MILCFSVHERSGEIYETLIFMGGYPIYGDRMSCVTSLSYLYQWSSAAWHGISGLYMIKSQKAQGSAWTETFLGFFFNKYGLPIYLSCQL